METTERPQLIELSPFPGRTRIIALMSLERGTRLGPYEILAPIGAGGMGEVYKAQDIRLDRVVAIKVLPEHLAGNPERKQRFEREAKAISKLNHPHICTLHDIGEQDGIRLRHLSDEAAAKSEGYGGQVDYLVMEHIEGETLAERLKKGALPLDQALEYGMQIADALDKAHRARIVHRDLKPGNVMLTKSGIKILDFGLARLTGPEPLSESSEAPTQQKNLTGDQALLGTLQYMAPEQLEGKPADARSDHWALGCLLYEMVTGKKAFEGGSQASLISAIMTAEAPRISSQRPITPPSLERLVSTCLAKDPDERWQSAGDLRRELEWIAAQQNAPAESIAPPPKGWLGWGIAGVLAVMLVVATWRSPRAPEATPDEPVRFVLDLPPGQLLAGFNVPGVRSTFSRYQGRVAPLPLTISPDGTRIVYEAESEASARTHLYLKKLSELGSERLPETVGASRPFFSPDGNWLGFYAEERLWKLSLSRGTRTALCDVTLPLLGVAWLPDDTIVFGDHVGRLMRVSANGGDPEVLTEPRSREGEIHHLGPRALPGGRALLFTVETTSGAFISALDVTSGERKRLVEGRWPRYVAPGFVVFSSGTSPQTADLMAVRFDASRMETTGAPFPVLQSLYADAQGTADWGGDELGVIPFAAISTSGTIVYVPSDALASRSRLVWVDRNGGMSPVIDAIEPFEYPRLSPDDTQLAVALHYVETTGKHEVWTYDLERGTRRLIEDGQVATRPFWTPDGSSVTYASGGGNAIYVQPLDDTDRETLVSRDGGLATAWLPSGKVLFTVRSSSVGLDIYTLTSSGELEPILANNADEHSPRPSPDGRWLAFASNESGIDEVYLRPYPGPGRTLTVSVGGGTDPVWSPVGNELFYRNGNDLMVVPIQTSPHAILGRPRKLFELPFLGAAGPTNPGYDVTSDGQRFIMVQPVEDELTDLVHVILNWDEELKQLAPSD